MAIESPSLRVLGVDPGSWATGWGLLTGGAARPRLVGCGVIHLERGGEGLARRLALLQRRMEGLVRELRPAGAAVESPFHGSNARSALQLAHARGVILAVLACAGVPVTEYTPATVKKSVTGNGRAPKDQVRRMVAQLLGSAALGSSRDASDALAVALCHAAGVGYHAAVERTRERRAGSPLPGPA